MSQPHTSQSEQTGGRHADVERGAAEDNAGAPLTETEIASSERPPSEPGNALPEDSGSSGDLE